MQHAQRNRQRRTLGLGPQSELDLRIREIVKMVVRKSFRQAKQLGKQSRRFRGARDEDRREIRGTGRNRLSRPRDRRGLFDGEYRVD